MLPIKHNRPEVTAEDRAAVERVLASGHIAHGPQVRALEKDFTDRYGGGACACSSGTAALFLALKGLDIGPGDTVAVPTYACSALLNAVHLAGASPVVADVNATDFNLSPEALAAIRPRPRAAIVVHTYGAAADIAPIRALTPLVVEDCCQALGGARQGRPLGLEGDAAVFSFYATKILTCGHGGLVLDKAGTVAAQARDYRDFDGRETYVPRFNFHLTDFQAAMVRSQWQRLAAIAARRRAIARRYAEVLPPGIAVQAGIDDPERMVYRFVLRLNERKERDVLREHFRNNNVETTIPVERFELLHRYLKIDPSLFPNSERLVDTTVSLPIYPALSDEQVAHIRDTLAAWRK